MPEGCTSKTPGSSCTIEMISGSGGKFSNLIGKPFIGPLHLRYILATNILLMKLYELPPLPEIAPIVHGWGGITHEPKGWRYIVA